MPAAASNAAVRELQSAMLTTAERGLDVPFPAYTHMQRAQPTTAAQWLLSHFWPLVRGRDRLRDARSRVARLPLGAAAGTGSTVAVDRDRLARTLGFDGPCENSLDAVGSRDWVAEVLFAWTQLAGDLSRLAEDLVLYASVEFGLVRLSDAFSTGSSLMPQKRNPDGAELARARGGTLLGLLTGYLASLKGLPDRVQQGPPGRQADPVRGRGRAGRNPRGARRNRRHAGLRCRKGRCCDQPRHAGGGRGGTAGCRGRALPFGPCGGGPAREPCGDRRAAPVRLRRPRRPRPWTPSWRRSDRSGGACRRPSRGAPAPGAAPPRRSAIS